ncbi:MAG: PD-(D/E)XK nuclease family protein [Sulfurimonas sp.]|jgi:RecB family exonuclease|nr:PD-(D/E)XK nuclease family protein [Sulfurimonas sp.]
MNTQTIILPSARAIRHEQLQIQEETLFLPNYITMSEFLSKLCIVPQTKYIDDDTRVLLLLEASDFANFAKLQIERNFFTFTKNASYIFKFFEELSAEMYDISLLDTADMYAEYEEHILILQELYKRYEALCAQRKVLDKIFLSKQYIFNHEYLSSHPKILLHVVGHLTNFELEILQRCCTYSSVEISLATTRFNAKMQERFRALGFELLPNHHYKLSLNSCEILEQKPLTKETLIECESLSESLLQVAFIKHKIYEFIQKGYAPEKLAVILPDEQFAQTLKSFDTESNFNFAMGESFATTQIYQKLHASSQAIENDSKENLARLKRFGDEYYQELFPLYKKEARDVDFLALMSRFSDSIANKQERKIYEEEIFHFKTILPFMQNMRIKSLLHLFLQRLSSRTIDDVRGGKITVMGVLETRAVQFDGVVIVDFSDNNVPKKSQKDMFLNTQIRENAKLPTMADRENLQKHYYELLLRNAKEAAICFVASQQSAPSRFLKQLGIEPKNRFDEHAYAHLLFTPHKRAKKEEQEIVAAYDFKEKKLSATKLKTFLECRRKFYYRYILSLRDHEIPKDMPQEWEIGTSIHEALRILYTNKQSFSSYEELSKELERSLDLVCGKSELEKYQIALYKRSLRPFCENEIKRFDEGWQVLGCEQSYEYEFAGLTLTGQIDRIDKRGEELLVLDYKTGSYPLYTEKNLYEATDFQLEFYYLLAHNIGNSVSCAYYDLKSSKIVPESYLNEKLAVLESNIKDLLMHESFEFIQCEDLKTCSYCEFATLCRRA